MKKSVILKRLEDRNYSIKDKFLRFNSFKLFKINKTYFKKRNFEDILVLESKGKIFEYWISQDLLIAPWETHWFQLKDSFLFKLKGNLLKNLLEKGIEKAGNVKKLSEKIRMSYPSLYNLRNDKGIVMISNLKLRKLFNYLNLKYHLINNKIEYTKKGNQISIKNPEFPINLNNNFGARLLGMIVSDGCIYIDKKARNVIRTKYSTGEKESINKFVDIINSIYGKTFIQKERIRNCDILKIGSSIIGDSLLKVGAILGHKAKKDGEVPWLIKFGNKDLKRNYLNAVFEDEASVYDGKGGYIILSRNKHLKELTKIQKSELKRLEKFMSNREFPTGHVNKRISIRKSLEKIKDKNLKNNLSNCAPKLLIGESKLLKEFYIENRLWGSYLSKTSLGNYSVSYNLFVSRKEAILKFYKEIGFSLKHKKIKLLNLINNLGGERSVKVI